MSTIKVNNIEDVTKLGIGTSSPSHPLHLVTSTDGTGVSGDDTWAAIIQNAEATDARSYGLKIMAGSTTDQALAITDHDGSNDLMAVQGSGAITKPKQPAACITGVADAMGAGSEVNVRFTGGAPTVKYNIGSHMDVTTGSNGGRFTCPVAGYYLCIGNWYAGGSGTSYMGANVYKNGGAFGQYWYNNASNYSDDSTMCSLIIQASANDYFDMKVYGSSADSTPAVFFQVHLLN